MVTGSGPYTDLTYQPMQEVLSYLRANGFKTYIVTGGGAGFRAGLDAQRVYGIPPEQVVGSTAGGTKYSYDQDGKPILTKEPGASSSMTTTPANLRAFTS